MQELWNGNLTSIQDHPGALEANPLEDITNTRQIAGVMVRGTYYARADLDLMLDAVAQEHADVFVAKIARRVSPGLVPAEQVLACPFGDDDQGVATR